MKKTASKKKFTREDYKNWLTSYSPKTKVGIGDETPITRFRILNGITTENPKWADKLENSYASMNQGSISATVALRMLEETK